MRQAATTGMHYSAVELIGKGNERYGGAQKSDVEGEKEGK